MRRILLLLAPLLALPPLLHAAGQARSEADAVLAAALRYLADSTRPPGERPVAVYFDPRPLTVQWTGAEGLPRSRVGSRAARGPEWSAQRLARVSAGTSAVPARREELEICSKCRPVVCSFRAEVFLELSEPVLAGDSAAVFVSRHASGPAGAGWAGSVLTLRLEGGKWVVAGEQPTGPEKDGARDKAGQLRPGRGGPPIRPCA